MLDEAKTFDLRLPFCYLWMESLQQVIQMFLMSVFKLLKQFLVSLFQHISCLQKKINASTFIYFSNVIIFLLPPFLTIANYSRDDQIFFFIPQPATDTIQNYIQLRRTIGEDYFRKLSGLSANTKNERIEENE